MFPAAPRFHQALLLHPFGVAFPGLASFGRPAELRIDVARPADEVEHALDELERRIGRHGEVLHGTRLPGFLFLHREAGGEHYVYVRDAVDGRLAGYTVFNRVPEAGRGAGPFLRAPHSTYRAAYQRRGIASAIYRWWLDGGRCLISGARQSAGAHALWRTLAKDYGLVYVDVRDKSLCCLGRDIDAGLREALPTRMILLGQNWDLERLACRAGMRVDRDQPRPNSGFARVR